MLEDFDSELERTWDEVIQKSFDEDDRPAAIDIQRHPLIEAVIQGNVSSVREMISNGQNVNEVVQGLGTPLIWAAIQGHDDIVHELLEAGADADLNEYSDVNARENAIVLHIGLVESLQEELATTTLDSVNESLVCRAICEHRRIIGRLQGRYDDFTSYGNTALMYAAMNGHGSIVRDLLLVGADVNMLGSDGLSAVWYAAIFRHVDVLKDLICAGAMVGGSSSMLHVLPFIPGSIGWIAAFLRTLPAQLAWPPIPKLLRAIQCIRLFLRMINCVPVPRLEARNSPNDAAQLRELLFMVDARTDRTFLKVALQRNNKSGSWSSGYDATWGNILTRTWYYTNQYYAISPIRDDYLFTQTGNWILGNHDEEVFKSPELENEDHLISLQPLIMEPHESDNYNEITGLLEKPENLDLLARKSAEERRTWFRGFLVADRPLELCESRVPESEPVERALRFFMAKAEIRGLERQFAEEARRVFYEENTIVVWSGVLESFLEGSYGDNASDIPVCDLVRQTTIKFISYVEVFEFLEDIIRKHRPFMQGVSLKVETDRARHGTAPGKLRMLCVIVKILLFVLYLLIAWMVLSLVRLTQWIGSMLIGRHT
ncbi:ankyrin repeat protein [Metarhizium robertsii]|uniref:Ankyrin repeat protein n=1 Tax=Metarhizium robertsii TaxID=568076 RepID=A0A014PHX7_9HYPO|nr:ankyrin repeat protein [Metarhizium robertsii]